MDYSPKPRIERTEGVTPAERYLKRLCDRTFLSLWSYPGVYRDQGRIRQGDGKEVCDLLVVFERDVIIFSDKYCRFPRTDDLQLDWSRWFRRAVLESANQVWGAERWIKQNPSRLYLDRSCTVPFPIDLPESAAANFHRIVVAHNGSQRCQEVLGGSGSLMLMPHIMGSAHFDGRHGSLLPFAIGQVDPTKGYVHVLDDTTLDILLRKLDTISDFVSYLTKKERFVTSGRLSAAAGEEELLACYLTKLNSQGEHDFVFPEGFDQLAIDVGLWEDFDKSPERQRQIRADEVSYTWDRLIEKFAYHILGGTSLYNSHSRVADQVIPLQFLARENRTRRRMLSTLLLELLKETPVREMRATRVVKPVFPGDPYYVFLLLSVPPNKPLNEYREVRRLLLAELCRSTKLRFPDALDIVGLATEPGLEGPKTEDVVYLDARYWTPEIHADAQEAREDLGLLNTLKELRTHVQEYPAGTSGRRKGRTRPPSVRNSPCPCGSGRKYKKCCGRGR
jgi:hypothetical protein